MLKLRRAEASDEEFLYSLRNDPSVCQASWNTAKVPLETHKKWLQEALKDPAIALYILEVDGIKAGQMRFNLKEEEISLSLTESFRGLGIASKALALATDLFFQEHQEINQIVAYIKPDNLASIKAFTKAGFIDQGLALRHEVTARVFRVISPKIF